MKTDQTAFLSHILDAIKKIEKYLKGSVSEPSYTLKLKIIFPLFFQDVAANYPGI